MAPSYDNSVSSELSFRSRQQFWDNLKNNPQQILDVAIIGGGIVGAGLLQELTLRGVKNAYLFEQNDFASGTSGASSKLIHAGIRYLEQMWIHLKKGRAIAAWKSFRFVWDASWERKRLGQLYPDLIKPKPIHLILSQSDPRSSLSVLAGTYLYYLMGIAQGQFFPPPSVIFNSAGIKQALPELDATKTKASFSFWDSETDDAQLTLENVVRACGRGASALNYVEVLSYEQAPDGVVLKLKNRENNETVVVRAKSCFNCTGAFVDEVIKTVGHENSRPLLIDRVAGSHLDVYPALSDRSYYVSASDNRLVFLLRRESEGIAYTRIGTTERPLEKSEPSDNPEPSAGEVEYLQNIVSEYFPQVKITENSILRKDAGIRPLRSQSGTNSFNKSREHDIIVEGRVVHVVGVKLTDFRRVAREMLRTLPFERWNVTLGPAESSAPLRRSGFTSAQDIVQRTMVMHWNDYLWRRRGIYPFWLMKNKPAELEQEFEAVATTLNWDAPRRKAEKEGSHARGK